MQRPIDFVITWVDGNDPEWQAEKARYNPSAAPNVATAIRYREWDNLRYWFRALEAFTPWVNKVHFITWGHTPPWLNLNNPKLNVVKHSDFMPEAYLPTFNSRPIELNMHRIEGLSDQFVYFNDDMFILKPMRPEDFFRDGLPRDVGVLAPYPSDARNSIAPIVSNNMEIINTIFDRKKTIRERRSNWFNPRYRRLNRYTLASLMYPRWFTGFWGSHFPNNYLKQTFETVWAKEYQALDLTCRHKFRDRQDVNHWLIRYWQLASNQFVPRDVNGRRYFALKNDMEPVTKTIRAQQYLMVCLNDREGIDDFEGAKRAINQAFETILPGKSSFEV